MLVTYLFILKFYQFLNHRFFLGISNKRNAYGNEDFNISLSCELRLLIVWEYG